MRFAAISAALIFAAGVGAIAGPMDGKHSHAASEPAKKNTADWPVYGGTAENNHFSSLQQINRSNVRQLAVAWTFDTGESGGLQTSPIVVDGVLYGLTPSQKVFALNAATGQ